MRRCDGCGAAVGETHDRICDVARCRATGLQWAACDHSLPAVVPHEIDTWTGRWPGQADCERLGFYTRLVPGQGWIPCGPDEPDAQPDLNRLYAEATWDPWNQRWVSP